MHEENVRMHETIALILLWYIWPIIKAQYNVNKTKKIDPHVLKRFQLLRMLLQSEAERSFQRTHDVRMESK